MATCKTTHRNDCWITRSAREGDPEDKVNNSPNFECNTFLLILREGLFRINLQLRINNTTKTNDVHVLDI